jgi:hypothetical protein
MDACECRETPSSVEKDMQILQAARDTATTMMAITDIDSLVISRAHCFGVAQQAYSKALALVPRVAITLSAHDEAILWARLDPIRDWLERTGRRIAADELDLSRNG